MGWKNPLTKNILKIIGSSIPSIVHLSLEY
jgi:hypothetical protein